ncbi:hypothetical protein Ndes2437B_g07494 [Nannochloris sp. 'desiccata']
MFSRSTHLFITFAVTALMVSTFAPSVAASRRHLVQALEGCEASPGSQIPPECDGGLFSGNQWDEDEVECQLEEGYQLKCDHNLETFGSNTVRCEIDQGPLSSEIEFECPVDGNCQINCDWADVQGKLPGAVYPATRRILTAWKPTEDIFG